MELFLPAQNPQKKITPQYWCITGVSLVYSWFILGNRYVRTPIGAVSLPDCLIILEPILFLKLKRIISRIGGVSVGSDRTPLQLSHLPFF